MSEFRVPWNAAWSSEIRYEIRHCPYAGMKLAMWQPETPGIGKPVFAKPHSVRQRRSIWEMRCTVCGRKTPATDRWWFKLGTITDDWFMTTEAPVHRACARRALEFCPHLRGRERDLERLPGGYTILRSIVGGPATDEDFGIKVPPGGVVGALKIAWPAARIRFDPPKLGAMREG